MPAIPAGLTGWAFDAPFSALSQRVSAPAPQTRATPLEEWVTSAPSSIVRTDNGPEFTSRVFIAWTQHHGIEHLLIEPGRPMQNGYIESFNGKFRDECLNEHWFTSLA